MSRRTQQFQQQALRAALNCAPFCGAIDFEMRSWPVRKENELSSEFTGGGSTGVGVTGDELRRARQRAQESSPRNTFHIDLDRSRASKVALGENVVVSTGGHNFHVIAGDVVGRDINIAEHENIPKISVEQAFERIGAAFRLNLQQLEKNIEKAREESNQFFRLTLLFSCLGFFVILSAVGLILADQVNAGVVTAVSSIIPESMALLFFKKDRELRYTIEAYHNHMLDSQKSLTLIDVAETIASQPERDRIKREIILSSLGVETELP